MYKQILQKNCRLLIFFFTVLMFLNSCKSENKPVEYTIGFSQCIGSDLWRKTMLEEMRTELSLHKGVRFIYADAQGDSKKQIAQVSKMIKGGIDLLIISPNEAQPLTPIVEDAYNKGLPVIVIDRKTTSPSYTAYVGADNYQIGKMAGLYIGSSTKGKINLIEVMGLAGSSPAIERDRGFIEGIKRFPNVQIRNKIHADWIRNKAESQLLRIRDSISGIDAVFAHNDVMAEGARTVLNKLHLSKAVSIIGVDALPGNGGGLQMVDNKVIDASLVYPTGGKEAVVTALKILNKEPFEKENILQSLVIDSTNVRLMKMQLDKINSQQRDIVKQQTLLDEQDAIYRNQQVILNVIIISLVLAIVFGGLAFYWLMENRKINNSLEIKNNEILFQRNQLIEMSARAEVATEARLNFFTNVSHEFRTPLTLMLSPLQDMLTNEKLTKLVGDSMKLIQQNAYRLLKLVNELIDYRKIEFDKQTIKASENNLVDFVRDIMESFRLHAQNFNFQLTLHAPQKEIKVWFDVNMLDKVFFNLIANALKFTKKKVKINIRKNGDDFVFIDIEDDGIGMTLEDASLIFDQFYQADHAPITGSGIGLSLSKEIVLFHHGQIEVSSKKWVGTVFTVALPLGDKHLKAEDKVEYYNEWPDLTEKSKIYQADLNKNNELIESDPMGDTKEHSLLIVEDNPDLLQYLVSKFADTYEIYTASNGNAAITKAYESVPDLILSDVVMPGISGKTLSERLKSDLRTSHIPIILLTAQGSIENQISGIRSMADLYITKPFSFEYLEANVLNLIKNRVILKEHFTSDISSTEKLPVSKSLDKKFINDFSGIVEQNLSNENFSVEDICKIIGISRIQLYRKVKALMDCSITDYIMNRRLKKAKYLLNNESLTIAEITYQVGLSNQNYFATVFKSKYGCTPSEFRKKNAII